MRSIVVTLETLASKAPDGLTLISDDNPLYRAALRKLDNVVPAKYSIRHYRFADPDRKPGIDQTIARERDAAMFPVDLLHKLLRHSHAHHRRETIAFGRKESNVDGRTQLFAVWRNFIKLVSERRPTNLKPAMQAGLSARVWTWAEVLSERLFEARIELDAC